MAKIYTPAEWESHKATWLTLPHNIPNTWYEGLDDIWEVYIQMIYHLRKDEIVHLIIKDTSLEEAFLPRLKQKVGSFENIEIHSWDTNDSWIRDYGPIFSFKDGNKIINNFSFNSWGGKYPWELDNAIPDLIAENQHLEQFRHTTILEGGSIDWNTKGEMLTTSCCLLTPTRNKNFSKETALEVVQKSLGMEKLMWIDNGIPGDDTDGHVDNLARFTNDTTIVCAFEENKEDANYSALNGNRIALENLTNIEGKKYNVLPLPMPDGVFYKGEKLPGSYLNFLIANKKVLLPVYNCGLDKEVVKILEKCFPDREIITIDYSKCILGLGSLHCLSMQEPSDLDN